MPRGMANRPCGASTWNEGITHRSSGRRQTWAEDLESIANPRKAVQFGIVLLHLGIAQRRFEELAEQRDNPVVGKDQAGLQGADELLRTTGFHFADDPLQEFLRPEGVASEFLRVVDGIRTTVADGLAAKAPATDQTAYRATCV